MGGGDTAIGLRYNSDTTSGNYAWQRMYGTGGPGSDSGSDAYYVQIPANTENASLFGYGIIDIPNYRNTNMFKSSRSFSGFYGSYTASFYLAQIWKNTDAITSITISSQTMGATSQIAAGSMFSLYGLV
jgi:hypothetical protein